MATMPPTDRDEASFAQATKQMIETGDYLDIRLQDKPRYQKPIGIYWLQAAAVKLFDPRIPTKSGPIGSFAARRHACGDDDSPSLGTLLFGARRVFRPP